MALTFAERMAALKGSPSTPALEKPIEKPIEEPVEPTMEKEIEKVEVPSVGKVIALANAAGKIIPLSEKERTEGEALVREVPADALNIKQKISQLESFEGINLSYEMNALRELIKASPDACLYLLPEETGLAVRALRRMTDNKVAFDLSSTRTKAASKKTQTVTLTSEELKAALDDL